MTDQEIAAKGYDDPWRELEQVGDEYIRASARAVREVAAMPGNAAAHQNERGGMNGFMRAAGVCWRAGGAVAQTANGLIGLRARFEVTSFHLAPGEVPTTAMLNDLARYHRSGSVRRLSCLERLVRGLAALLVVACCPLLLAVCLGLLALGGLQLGLTAGARAVLGSDAVWEWRRRTRATRGLNR
ncbi:MAG TPA: hypothetical protein VF221_22850 [Chloroflexota bacterium]